MHDPVFLTMHDRFSPDKKTAPAPCATVTAPASAFRRLRGFRRGSRGFGPAADFLLRQRLPFEAEVLQSTSHAFAFGSFAYLKGRLGT